MNNRRFISRPNRRQLDLSLINVPPISLQWTGPGIDAGKTHFTGALSQHGCKVVTTVGGTDVTAITLAGSIDGVFGIYSAERIENMGEDGSGTVIDIVFDGALATTQPWLLSIPFATPLIAGPSGGRLVGTLNIDQVPSDANGGFIRQSNLSDGPLFPSLMWPIAASVAAGNEIDVSFNSISLDPLTIIGIPDFTDSAGGAALGVIDQGGGNIAITFTGGCTSGSTLTFPAWQNSLRGPSGEYVSPFELVTT